jgi:mannose/fructose-specific phosphotransferase system component IIA
MVNAILVTHGDLAAELMRTARSVFGEYDGCQAVNNEGKTPQTLADEIDRLIAAGPPGARYIVFVDFFGGSCCHACLTVEQAREDVRIVAGVNLPMLLAFLYKREEVPFEQLPDELIARGRNSIRRVSADDF